MTSAVEVIDEEPLSTLPPQISNNPREKIEPEKIPTDDIVPEEKIDVNVPLVKTIPKPEPKPSPLYSLSLCWSPSKLCFEIDKDTIVNKLLICNCCARSIYIHCCGFWDETARLGAKWWCYPRTRFLLAPGLTGEVSVRAEPRSHSPVPCAYIALQLAAAHKRDHVTGFFVVPIVVKFLNFVQCTDESG